MVYQIPPFSYQITLAVAFLTIHNIYREFDIHREISTPATTYDDDLFSTEMKSSSTLKIDDDEVDIGEGPNPISLAELLQHDRANDATTNGSISATGEKSVPSCTKFEHSEKWLAGPRMSNANETDMSEELVLSLIMGGMPRDINNGSDDALGQTMCYEQSRIRNWDPLENFQNITSANQDDGLASESAKTANHSIRYLTYKLMLLAIHENQHRPAKAEALARYGPDKETSCYDTPETRWDIGKFDFQCDPKTKYIVADLGHKNGLGMVIKTTAVEPFFFSLMSDRVLLWNNMSPSNFFSCDRKDWQCLFMPMSPCVLEDVRVILLRTVNYREEPKGIREVFVRHINALFDRNASSESTSNQPWNLDSATLEMVKDELLDVSDIYHQWFIWSPGLLYMLRPNLRLRARLDQVIEDSVPKDFNPDKSIGIPIRAGDKCWREQNCYKFEKYIQVAEEMGSKRRNQTSNIYDTIVLTSDSRDMVESRLNYTSTHPNAAHPDFPFRFLINENDIMQGHGSPKRYQSQADDIMTSTIAAMKMQMLAETVVSNKCSNFHMVLGRFHRSGCGMAQEPYSETLQSIDNLQLSMRCN